MNKREALTLGIAGLTALGLWSSTEWKIQQLEEGLSACITPEEANNLLSEAAIQNAAEHMIIMRYINEAREKMGDEPINTGLAGYEINKLGE